MDSIHPRRRERLALTTIDAVGHCALISCVLGVLPIVGCTERTQTSKEGQPSSAQSDPFARKTGALMLPGAHRAFVVVDGETLFNGEWALSFRASRDGRPMDGPVAVRFEGQHPPCLVWQLPDSLIAWHVSAVAGSVVNLDPGGFLASIEFEIKNTDSLGHEVALESRLSRPTQYPFVARDGLRLRTEDMNWPDATSGRTAIALGPSASQDSVLVVRSKLGVAEVQRWRFVVASHPVESATLVESSRIGHEQWKRDAIRAWHARQAGSAKLHLDDPVVEEAAEQALFVLLACTESNSNGIIPIGNPFQYRDTWIRDGARQIAALSQWSLTADACDLALSLTAFQLPDGGFMSQRGQLDGTGQVLWGMDQAFGRAGSRSPPDSLTETIVRAWRWLEQQRDKSRRFSPAFAGLMPPADPRDGELRRGHLVGNDCWSMAGYRSAESIIRRAGLGEQAQAIRQSILRYQELFRARLGASGEVDVPAAWRGPARDWGNLSVVYPCGVLEPSDRRVRGLANRVWATRRKIGLATYGSPDSLHTYMAADLATWALLDDQQTGWDSMLVDMIRWRTGTGGAPELFSSRTLDFGTNLPPHATAAATLLTTLRNGLVFDDLGDTLRLTMGTRTRWWAGSSRLTGASTRWGTVDVSFALVGQEAQWTWTPVPVWTVLRVPPGWRVGKVPVPLRERSSHTILAPPGTGRAALSCTRD